MTKEEKINKLKHIKPTSFPTVVTYDAGLQFDVMNEEGIGTYLDVIAEWPLWKLKRLEKGKLEDIKIKISKNELIVSDFENTEFYTLAKELVEFKKMNLNTIFNSLDKFPYSDDNKYVYIYSDTKGWDDKTLFFETEEKLKEYFFDIYPIQLSWDKVYIGELDECLENIAENGEGIFFWTFTEGKA